MWSKKLGLPQYNQQLCDGLIAIYLNFLKVDFTIFFRELSHLPTDFSALNKSFYKPLPQAARGASGNLGLINGDD